MAEDEEKEFYIDMIEIGDRALIAFYLYSFRRIEGFVNDDYRYSLLLNEGPLPVHKAMYENTLIHFKTERERDEEYLELKRKITTDRNVRFIE